MSKYDPLACAISQKHVLLKKKLPFACYYQCKDCGQRFTFQCSLLRYAQNFIWGTTLKIYYNPLLKIRKHAKNCYANVTKADEYCDCGWTSQCLHLARARHDLTEKIEQNKLRIKYL